MTDKPRVEPSVSEPAPDEKAPFIYRAARTVLDAFTSGRNPTESQLNKLECALVEFGATIGYCCNCYREHAPEKCWNRPPVIAPQPTPEPPTLREALQVLYDETADYIRINHLGDVHHNRSMQMARDALAAPQGVGKLSPEQFTHVCTYCDQPIQFSGFGQSWIGRDGMQRCEDWQHFHTPTLSRELPVVGRYLCESEPKQMQSNLKGELRSRGWMVAVHNDYRVDGKSHTFWLFTHADGRYIKGEGETDEQALAECLAAERETLTLRAELRTCRELLEDSQREAWELRSELQEAEKKS